MTLEELKEANPYLRIMDGYDDCIIGMMERFGLAPVFAYSRQKVLAKLVSEGMTEEEAEEFYEYNMLGAYVGEETPCFVDLLEEK